MSTTMWGPALQAEVDYRQEQVRAARGARPARPRRARRARGGVARVTVPARAAGGAGDARGWPLPGSGAWHAAR